MPQRSGLGKGLDALIPSTPGFKPGEQEGGVKQASVDAIARNPHQPRASFDQAELKELADSIREHGILQPLIVSLGSDGTYTLIAGERRLEAAKQAGLQAVPVVLRQASDQDLVELALIENLQRSDLNPLEEAEAYRQLTEDFGLSHEDTARRIGKSRVAVTNTLRLLNLAEPVKQALIDKKLSGGHARALLALPTLAAQAAVAQTVISRELNVRQTEELVRKYSGKKPSRPIKQTLPEVLDLEARLQDSLGTKVRLRHGKKGGSVVIHYYSDEELEALLGKLL